MPRGTCRHYRSSHHPHILVLEVGVNIWAGGKARAEISLPGRKVVLPHWGRRHEVPQTGGFANRVSFLPAPGARGLQGRCLPSPFSWAAVGRLLLVCLRVLSSVCACFLISSYKDTSHVGLEKEMATHASILAWEIPWTEEPGGLQSMGSQKSD